MEAYKIAAPTAPFDACRAQLEQMIARVSAPDSLRERHSDTEEYIATAGRELQRRMLQEQMDLRGAAERRVSVRGDDGVRRTSARVRTRGLTSLFGGVSVARLVYEAAAMDYRAPLDATLNLPTESYSHSLRRLAAAKAAITSFDEAVEEIESATGVTVPKRQLEQLVQRAAEDFTQFYESSSPHDDDPDDLLVLTFDAKGIVMLKRDLRPATRKAAEAKAKRRDRPMKRLARGEKRNRKRMAEVAAVYAIAPFPRTTDDVVRELGPVRDLDAQRRRPRPSNKRVWASVVEDAQTVIETTFQEALRRDPQKRRRWVVLLDGNETQIDQVRRGAHKHGVHVTIVLDLIHVLEYLWKAAYCFHADGTPQAEAWVQHRLRMLLDGTSASDVAAGMTRSATLQSLVERAAVDRCADYLLNNALFIRYAEALHDGLPIATGVIEGACRYLVKDRMDRTGARWSLVGAEAVLRLRALRTNGDFDDYWTFHLDAEYRRRHASRYEGDVPDPLAHIRPNRPPRLRRVK